MINISFKKFYQQVYQTVYEWYLDYQFKYFRNKIDYININLQLKTKTKNDRNIKSENKNFFERHLEKYTSLHS